MDKVNKIFDEVIEVEAAALLNMKKNLNENFAQAVSCIQECTSNVVVIGMGKSGHIGRKIAATFASTGTPSYFIHPAEAFHGDLGMIGKDDVVLLISYSGETEELIRLFPYLKWRGNKTIALTGGLTSTLAKNSNIVLNVFVEKEACKNNLAPTSSTTATLVMGDALAVAVSTLNQFKPEDFARFHPGGSLGKRLLTRVADVMNTNLPIVTGKTKFLDVAKKITDMSLGLTLVMEEGYLLGIVTDGDLRRALDRNEEAFSLLASEFMTKKPKVILETEMFATAEAMMKEMNLNILVVVDNLNKPVGTLKLINGL